MYTFIPILNSKAKSDKSSVLRRWQKYQPLINFYSIWKYTWTNKAEIQVLCKHVVKQSSFLDSSRIIRQWKSSEEFTFYKHSSGQSIMFKFCHAGCFAVLPQSHQLNKLLTTPLEKGKRRALWTSSTTCVTLPFLLKFCKGF